jgi:periplasmic divalent cation tolerance protein
MQKIDYVMVISSVVSEEKAEILAKEILRRNLGACIQIQKIKSFYKWNGTIKRNDEFSLIIKTRSDLFSPLSEYIKKNHDYGIPEIIQIPIANGSQEYLEWLLKETTRVH